MFAGLFPPEITGYLLAGHFAYAFAAFFGMGFGWGLGMRLAYFSRA